MDLTAKDLKAEVDKALRSVTLPLSNQGVCSMVVIGNTSMKKEHLVENVQSLCDFLQKRYPGGWKNIRNISLKTETSMSIPIHVSTSKNKSCEFKTTHVAL